MPGLSRCSACADTPHTGREMDRPLSADSPAIRHADTPPDYRQLVVVCVASFVVWAGLRGDPALSAGVPPGGGPRLGRSHRHHRGGLLRGHLRVLVTDGRPERSHRQKAGTHIRRRSVRVRQPPLRHDHPAGWFVLFRLLEGIGAAAVMPAGKAFIADITTEATRSQAYGWLTTAQFGGLASGPALAVPLYALGGGHGRSAFYAIFLFGSVAAAITAVALLFTIREPEQARRRRLDGAERPPYRSLVTRPVAAFLVVAATMGFATGVWEVLWSLWLRHLGASMSFVGLTWIAFSLPMLLAFAGGRLADRHSRFLLMYSGLAVSSVAWIMYGITRNLMVFLVFCVIEGLAVAWSYPAQQAFLVQVSPRRWLGTIQGLESSSMQLAALVGTLLSPLLYQVISGYTIAVGGVIVARRAGGDRSDAGARVEGCGEQLAPDPTGGRDRPQSSIRGPERCSALKTHGYSRSAGPRRTGRRCADRNAGAGVVSRTARRRPTCRESLPR